MGIKGFTSLLMETGLWSSTGTSTSRGTKHVYDTNKDDNQNHINPNTTGTTSGSTVLEEHALYSNHPNDPNKQTRKTDKDIIEPGSTFLIDGPSFAFHCHRLAYYKYYQDTIDSFTKTRDLSDENNEKQEDHFTGGDILHLVHLLLPTCMPYTYIHDMTLHLLQSFAFCDIQCIAFYEDGQNHPKMDAKSLLSYMDIHKFKVKTQAHRDRQRQESQDRLTSFLVQQILPTSFASVKNKSEMPSAHVFLQEFPLPPLLHSQVRHSIQVFAHMYPYHMTIRRCYGECDRAIAMISYKDASRKTFALSHDSDYILFGLMAQNEVQNVQYIPLDTLELQDTYTMKGTVLTRCKVAETLHVTERVLLEASIVMGNDYTSSFMEHEHAQSTINFFQDLKNESHGMIHDRMKKQDIIDGMAYLIERNPMYQVTSDDSRIQQCIEFSRAWFTFHDISSFSSKHCQPVVSHEAQDIDSHLEDRDSLDGPTIDIHDAFSSDLEYIQRQITLLFVQTSKDEHDFSDAAVMLSRLDWKEMTQQPSDFLLSTNLKYLHHIQVSRFQKCVRKVLQSCFQESYNQNAICDLNGDIVYNESEECDDMESTPVVPLPMGPSDLFHPIKVYNYLASKDFLARQHLTASQSNTGIHQSSSSGLPIDKYRSEILSSIVNNRITIIEGETGSGKSSKVPIMIMEEPPPDPIMTEVKMFICQPRRIAAKSLVERVRSITTGNLKSKFALRMGHGHKEYETQESRAFFVTTGYMVRYLANNMHSFHNVTHLIIDEVHERSVDSDILCLLAKRLVEMHPHLRLVLMSATVASVKYREYFDSRANSIFVGRRCFPIREMFLEDICKELLFGSKEQQQIDFIRKESLRMRCLESPNSQYMSVLHRLSVLLATSVARSRSSVLIFVPGMADIIAISEMFEDIVTATNYVVLAVHSDIPFDEQMEIFDCRKTGEVRVIVATNAAESSITLPDVDHVFDFGLHKAISYNAKSHRQRLEASWISKASAIQRMGRTGRVRPGTVYRLYPKEIFTDYMAPFDVGEILRVPLDTTILNLRTIVNGSISSILTQCIEPPDISNIQNSFSSLFERRFISRPDDNFELTPIGTLVASLGLDLNLGAIISMGILFGLIPETIEMAAILSCPQTPWLIPNSILQEVDVYNGMSFDCTVSLIKNDLF